ncbi:hypothetical protein AOLI_G00151100 [Acnodon oligacanthus]
MVLAGCSLPALLLLTRIAEGPAPRVNYQPILLEVAGEYQPILDQEGGLCLKTAGRINILAKLSDILKSVR